MPNCVLEAMVKLNQQVTYFEYPIFSKVWFELAKWTNHELFSFWTNHELQFSQGKFHRH